MGSLNTFYVMGRVARPAVAAGTRHGHPVVTFGLSTSAQGREPVTFEAAGPQAEQALRLRPGQGVFVRGLLRADPVEGGGASLVAQVQALDVVLDGARLRPRPPREPQEGEASAEGEPVEGAEGEPGEGAGGEPGADGEPGASGGRRRPRRRRGRAAAPRAPPPRGRGRSGRSGRRGAPGPTRAAAAGADRGAAAAGPAAARPDLPLRHAVLTGRRR
ncbi:MAG: hypothetical protein M9894_12935 [Planctomycetes bacterium]|nr:hypothetical protein [Planctomycetota bacterium]